MAHVIQVGAGSGGMVVLDLICRDPRLTALTLIEPDVYKPHNIDRHYFPSDRVGRLKAELARDWLRQFRPDLSITLLTNDLTDPAIQATVEEAVAAADLGVCAVDNEPAKYHWDAMMRRHRKPWTLGEVLSGGIGGFVHRFVPDGPCYGCVASFLKRSVETERPVTPDYSQPGGPVHEVTIPASKASIQAIASLHAVATLQMLRGGEEGKGDGVTSVLLTLERVADVFDEAFRTYRFRIPRLENCLICQPPPVPPSSEDLDAQLAQALARLGDA
ncbi:MAG: ThiF family adenylyltransferase [Gemmatales bacterium]|nr:ThiF family adenylyltransferase [Gemmatales bacterium]MDW8387015.1 ThiF family adenylyltransferase [Gemmatales bacterium]